MKSLAWLAAQRFSSAPRSIGIVGEYIARVYEQSRQVPRYVIVESIGVESPEIDNPEIDDDDRREAQSTRS